MEALKAVLQARDDKSPQVKALLECLDAAFDLQVCICSVGGVGSTSLSNFLTTQAGLQCNLLSDQDAVRHVNRPPPHLPAGTKVVYLFGDPLAAVASHYRRNHALHQAQKTCGQPTKLEAATFPQSFQAYVDRGEDLFGIEQHLHNWLHTPSAYDVLFVRYEHMFDLQVAQAIFKNLCSSTHPDQGGSSSKGSTATHSTLDPQQLAAMFAATKQERASRVTEQQRQKMYTQLTAEMDALPPIFVRTSHCHIRPLVEAASTSS